LNEIRVLNVLVCEDEQETSEADARLGSTADYDIVWADIISENLT
jgi:hypothetical protein